MAEKMKLLTPRNLIIGGSALLLAVLVVLGVIFVPSLVGNKDTKAEAVSTPLPSVSALYSDSAPAAAKAIQKLETNPKAVLSDDALKQLGGDVTKAIPKGTKITPYPKTWHATGIGTGSMLVALTAPGEKPEGYLVIMEKENGKWKVVQTIQGEVAK